MAGSPLPSDHLAAMAVFARVVEAKGFSAAATQLGLSKSAVSKQVTRLEERLGARLMHRTTRRLALTEVGQVFYAHCQRIVAEAEDAEAAVSNLNARPRGALKVNLPVSFGRMHVAPLVPGFLDLYPETSLELSFTDRFVDLLEEGFDLAIRIGRLDDSSLVTRRLAPCRMVICGAPGYLRRHGHPKHPRELAEHSVLLYRQGGERRDSLTLSGPDGSVTVRLQGRLTADNGEALRDAAAAGLGLVVQPSFMLGEELLSGQLEPLLCDWTPDAVSIQAVYPSRRHLTPKVRAFVDYLAAKFGPEPYWDAYLRQRRPAA